MATLYCEGKSYDLDSAGYLKSFGNWDENFAKAMVKRLGMKEELTKEQWDVISFIHNTYESTGRCPNVYETCRTCGLHLSEMRMFFPGGYLRGACRIAGLNAKRSQVGRSIAACLHYLYDQDKNINSEEKTYLVDVQGFLVDPENWDEYYAVYRAFDMKIPGGKLTDRHWQIINYLRECYYKDKEVPTVYQTCEENSIDLDELEQLFPDGYHRGAVKIAGLRVR